MNAALAARSHGADAVLDAVELDGGSQGKHGDIADICAGMNGQGEHVIGEGEGGNWRAIVGLWIVDGPADGVGLPDVPGIVADDVAIDAPHAARHQVAGEGSKGHTE